MKRPLGFFALALSLACGSSSGSSPGPSQTNCDKSNQDAGPVNPADLQSTLTFQGRHDSGLDTFFGSASGDIFVQADQLLAAAGEDVAGQLNVTAGDPDLPSASCSVALHSGLGADSIHAIYRDMPLNLALAVLANQIDQIPFSTPIPQVTSGYKENTSGDPSIKANYEVRVSGSGNSKISVSARGTLDITSSTLGSVQEYQSVQIDVDVCPDASGKVRSKANLKLHGTSYPAGGGNGVVYDLSVNNDIVYLLDDKAEVAHLEVSGGAVYQTRGAQNNNVSAQATQTSDVNLHGATPTVTVVTDDGSADAQTLVGKNLLKPGDLVGVVAAGPSRKKWRGGTCLEVKIDPETTSIRPGQKLHLTASVRQKFDGSDLQVPVVATLDGSGELKPPGPDPVTAPAGYDYSGGATGEMGQLGFTTTSKRGIGSKSVTIAVCDTCGFKGTVSIDASGSVDSSLDGGGYTGNDHIGVEYNGSFRVESDAQGNLHAVDGSVDGTFTHTMQKHGSGKTEHCSWTLDESTNGSATGSAKVMPGDGSGSVSALDGQFQIYFSGPVATVEGSEDWQEKSTSASDDPMVNCVPGDSRMMTTPIKGDLRIYMSGSGTYDQAHPALTGSSTTEASAGGQTLFGVPVTVHASWSLQ